MSKIIICGPSASGKDHFRKKLQGTGFIYAVPYTTRPKREDEIEGHDYHFVEEAEFQNAVYKGHMYLFSEFNGWYYGISNVQWKNSNLFVLSPNSISQIELTDRKECAVFYLDIPVLLRKERLLNRSDMPGDTIERRLKADEKDFKDFIDYDFRITKPFL
jgi:guanylate kinase